MEGFYVKRYFKEVYCGIVIMKELSTLEDTVAGFQVTPYEVQDILGSGSFGQVFRCRDVRTGGMVAVKVPSAYNRLDEAERRFLLRIRESPDSRRATFVHLLDLVEVCGILSLVLEFLEMPLSSVFEQGQPMHISHVRCIGLQLLTAIDFLESCEIVHGDIKPDNIMVAGLENGVILVKLIDLGGFEVNQENPPVVWNEITSRPYRWHIRPRLPRPFFQLQKRGVGLFDV